MKRLLIEHETVFTYPYSVSASYNLARMIPTTTPRQSVLSAGLEVSPRAGVHDYVDHFGTRVSAFDVLSQHDDLRILSRSLVEVDTGPVLHSDLGWEELAAEARRTVRVVEQLAQTDRTRPPEEVVGLARSIAAEHGRPGEAAVAIARDIGAALEYVPGATGVHTTAADAWNERKGVCQDITHVVLGALRAVGLPARYVSGYLHPHEDARIGVETLGESHAWVEWFDGRWQGFDPTNGIEVSDRHVMVGYGRDYSDVPPLRGVYAGAARSEQRVRVAITREA